MKALLLICIAAALFISCGRGKYKHDASGTFEATEVTVSAEANGRLMRFDVTEGERVSARHPFGYIDTIQLYLKKMQLRANRKSVGSKRQDIGKQIAATQEQIAKQKLEKERTQRLLTIDAANRKQLDDINSQIAVLEKQLAAQLSTLESGNQSVSSESSALEIQIMQIDDQISKSIIQSPIEGTILTKYAEAGELTSTGRPLFKVADTDNMILRAYITSGQLTQLKIGQQVKISVDYGDDDSRNYTGAITWISDKAEFTPKTIQTRDERANLVYAIKIGVKNDGLIKIGMYGDVTFQ